MRLDTLAAFNAERTARRAAAIVTDLSSGAQRLVRGADATADPLNSELEPRLRSGKSGVVMHDGRETFLTVHRPTLRLIVVGAVHIAQVLADVARSCRMDVTVVDPRTAFATPERFPGVALMQEWPAEALPRLQLDPFTAIALLTHDPKIDDQALVVALRAKCLYVGALGSKTTHARRLERLHAEGFGDADLARIRAPIGLAIGAVGPAEIAVAIVAEIIAVRNHRLSYPEAAA